jgi:hypothetical protein
VIYIIYKLFMRRYCQVTFYPFLSSRKLDPWRQSFGIQELNMSYTELSEYCYECENYISSGSYDDEELFKLPKLFDMLYRKFSAEDFYFSSIKDYFQLGNVPESYKQFTAHDEDDEVFNDFDASLIAPEDEFLDNSHVVYTSFHDDPSDASKDREVILALRSRLSKGPVSSSSSLSVY